MEEPNDWPATVFCVAALAAFIAALYIFRDYAFVVICIALILIGW